MCGGRSHPLHGSADEVRTDEDCVVETGTEDSQKLAGNFGGLREASK